MHYFPVLYATAEKIKSNMITFNVNKTLCRVLKVEEVIMKIEGGFMTHKNS